MNHTHARAREQMDTNIHRCVYIYTQKLFVKNKCQYISNHTHTHTHTHTRTNLKTHFHTHTHTYTHIHTEKITVSEIPNHSNTHTHTQQKISKANKG